jgi:hypothetical protein
MDLHSVVGTGRSFVLLKGIAPVDDDELARDVRGGFGRQEDDRCGNFIRAARAADGSTSTGDHFLLRRRRGLNPAWGDGVYGDIFTGNFKSKTVGEPDHAGFGSAVCRFAGITHNRASHGRDIHDPPIVGCKHERQNNFGHVESCLKINGEGVIPSVFGKFSERQRCALSGSAHLSHASVVDEDIDPAIARDNFLNQGVYACWIPQIGNGCEDIVSYVSEFSRPFLDPLRR